MIEDLIEVKRNEELGRYAVLAANVSAGQVLFEEYPFVVGPKPSSPIVCLGCCSPISGNRDEQRCTQCKWPLCGECAKAPIHVKECKLFVENKVIFHNAACRDAKAPCLQLDCITPLRILLEKESNPEKWEKEISHMEYHDVARRNSPLWNVDEVNIVGYLHGPCKLKERFSKDLIRQVCGILDVNSFEARTKSGHSVRCIFPKTATMAHSCVPNTIHSILPSENFKIKVRAAVDIRKGNIAYTSYTYTLSGTSARQSHLKLGKYFTCHCQRCLDPTELQTYFSSVNCNKCIGGLISSTDPLDENAIWKCSKCKYSTNGSAVQKTISIIQKEVDDCQSEELTSARLEKTEKLLEKYSCFLHPDHNIQINLCQNLIEMYGRVPGYELKTMKVYQLERKKFLCLKVLRLLDIFQPGKTRTKAMLIYQLHGPLALLTKRTFLCDDITEEVFNVELQAIIDLLEESYEIFNWEDITSSEAKLAVICRNIINQLKKQM